MALVRCVTEMGMGVDVHGLDYTKAATRAVFDAIHHSSLGFQRMIGKTADDMTVDVTIGVSIQTKLILKQFRQHSLTEMGKAHARQSKEDWRYLALMATTACLLPTPL